LCLKKSNLFLGFEFSTSVSVTSVAKIAPSTLDKATLTASSTCLLKSSVFDSSPLTSFNLASSSSTLADKLAISVAKVCPSSCANSSSCCSSCTGLNSTTTPPSPTTKTSPDSKVYSPAEAKAASSF